MVKTLVKKSLNRFGIEVRRLARRPSVDDLIRMYISNGRTPWSIGYNEAKFQFIADTINDSRLLDLFRRAGRLPDGYGRGFDERCVEYPWCLAMLDQEHQRILDAGSTLNHATFVNHPLLSNRELHIMTLAPEDECFWARGISYLYGDLRNIPYRDAYFDLVICISTIEHIGMDNSLYAGRVVAEDSPLDYRQAIRELYRVTRAGGAVLITVPFGQPKNFGWFQQFDQTIVDWVTGNYCATELAFYRYTDAGWQVATLSECLGCTYSETAVRLRTDPTVRWPPNEHQAASGAILCIKIPKTTTTFVR